jgi:hypothetical protein
MCSVGRVLNPIGGTVPGDPIGSKVVEKVAPEPVKQIARAPSAMMAQATGEKTSSTLIPSTSEEKKSTGSLLG